MAETTIARLWHHDVVEPGIAQASPGYVPSERDPAMAAGLATDERNCLIAPLRTRRARQGNRG